MRRRGTALVVVLATLAVAGCGRDDFENNPRPPVPAEITVKIGNGEVAVSPREFGAGLVNFTIANLSKDPATLVIHGPVDASSPEIQPSSAQTVKVDMKTGSYEASADGVAVLPQQFTVGPERPSGQNELLLP
jgi:hypothetical protein